MVVMTRVIGLLAIFVCSVFAGPARRGGGAEFEELGGLGDLGALFGALGGMGGGDFGGAGGGGGRDKACKFPAPKKRSFLKLEVNGCGPAGMQVDEPYGLVKCCNRHDLCYWLCGTEYQYCEREFKKCMKGVCKKQDSVEQDGCREQANSLSGMTGGFGRGVHGQGQNEQCDCFQEKEDADKRHYEILEKFYNEHNATAATPENIDYVLQKYAKKEGELYYNLSVKYGKKFVKFSNVRDEL